MTATEQIAAARDMVDTWTLDHLRPHEYAAMCVVAALADTAEAQAQEIARLQAALKDALLQLQYLSAEQQRASTNAVMARIRAALGDTP